MNLVEKLLAVDQKEFDKIETEKVASRQLAKLLGADNAEVTIQAIDGDYFSSLSNEGLDKNGNTDYTKAFSFNAKIVAAGVTEPNLKDETLLKHLNVATPAEAAKKIFKGEVNALADIISKLSGFEPLEETEKEIKN